MHIRLHAHSLTRTLVYTHTRLHAHSLTRTLAYTHTRLHAHSLTRTLAYTHSRLHAHSLTRTLAHTQCQMSMYQNTQTDKIEQSVTLSKNFFSTFEIINNLITCLYTIEIKCIYYNADYIIKFYFQINKYMHISFHYNRCTSEY